MGLSEVSYRFKKSFNKDFVTLSNQFETENIIKLIKDEHPYIFEFSIRNAVLDCNSEFGKGEIPITTFITMMKERLRI